MKTCIYITTCGDVRYDTLLWNNLNATIPKRDDWQTQIEFLLDEPALANHYLFDKWTSENAIAVIRDRESKGLNALWTRCVARAALMERADICVVLNDDVYLPKGWLPSIVAVLSQNEHVALCGIACDPVWWQENRVRERWLTDPTLFQTAHYYQNGRNPIRYASWVCGFAWACKPKIWLDAGCGDESKGVPQFWWSYGEAHMGLLLENAGLFCVHVQYPMCLHYMGAAYLPGINDRVSQNAGGDAAKFEAVWGEGNSHLANLEEAWKLRHADNLPPLRFRLEELR